MPELVRPDGCRIHWQARGEGPLVVMVLQFFGGAFVFEGLISDLARDHRVVSYDPRGTGRSTRDAKLGLDLDDDDLEALIEHVGGPALVVCIADGTNRAARVATRRPDLITAVVTPGGNPVALEAARGTDALSGSQSVLEALAGMIETDYRGGLNQVIGSANVQLDEAGVKQRVQDTMEYVGHEVAVERMHGWIADDVSDEGRRLGDRLWMIEHGTNPWFPLEVAEKARGLLPEAHIEIVEDGPLSRPDITATYVRNLTGAGQPHASKSAD